MAGIGNNVEFEEGDVYIIQIDFLEEMMMILKTMMIFRFLIRMKLIIKTINSKNLK